MSSNDPPKITSSTVLFSVPPPGDTRPHLKVLEPGQGKLYEQNYVDVEKEILIENLRTREPGKTTTLDVEGFQLFSNCPQTTKLLFADEEEIVQDYYPESVELVKKLTGASQVIPFHHKIRRHQFSDKTTENQPAWGVHVDLSASKALSTLHQLLPESEEPRFQILSLWRPISHPAYDSPLALCDYRSVNLQEDTFPVAFVQPTLEGEMLAVKYNENYKWGYFYGMTPEEVLLIKLYDSVKDEGIAVCTPHTAFEDPATPKGSPPRESIELRILVVYN